MTSTLVIGGKLDGTWIDRDQVGNTIVWPVFIPTTFVWVSDPNPLDEMPIHRRTATYRRYYHPSWRIILDFYVADELPRDRAGMPIIPVGTVMPGMIHGEILASSPLCRVCRRHADTPAGNLCFKHMIELLNEHVDVDSSTRQM